MKRNKYRWGFALGLPVCLMTFVGQVYAQGTWTTKAPMPTPRWGLSAGVVNGKLYAVGGVPAQFSCSYLATNEAYDAATDTWSTQAPMLTARESLGVGVINGILYAVGGGTGCGPFTAALEAYDPGANFWISKAPMPTPRRLHATGVVNGILYVVGGTDNVVALATVLAYDPSTNTWTARAPLSAPRDTLSAGVVNGILYAVGGFDAGGYSARLEAYDPTTNTWTTRAPMPTPRANLAVGVVNGTLYAAGGYNASGPLATVEAYDPATDTWTSVASMPTARLGPAADAVAGTLYVVGGEDFAGDIFASNEAFIALTPFSKFTAKLDIVNSTAPNTFDLNGQFTLGPGGSIDPATEPVTLQVGPYTAAIPVGSFVQNKKGFFVFEGVINGVSLQFNIKPLGAGSYQILAEGSGASLAGTANPVTVMLTIGNDGGSTSVTADIE